MYVIRYYNMNTVSAQCECDTRAPQRKLPCCTLKINPTWSAVIRLNFPSLSNSNILRTRVQKKQIQVQDYHAIPCKYRVLLGHLHKSIMLHETLKVCNVIFALAGNLKAFFSKQTSTSHEKWRKVCTYGRLYLHPTHAHAQSGRGALLALLHLARGLLLGGVVAVLPCAHLQVQDARTAEVMYHVLEEQKFYRESQSRNTFHNKQALTDTRYWISKCIWTHVIGPFCPFFFFLTKTARRPCCWILDTDWSGDADSFSWYCFHSNNSHRDMENTPRKH